MKYCFEIRYISEKDKWIYITLKNNENDEIEDAFIFLLKIFRDEYQGEISEVGYCQYKISNLKYDIIFQYDDLFGIVVIYNDDKEEIVKFLKSSFRSYQKN